MEILHRIKLSIGRFFASLSKGAIVIALIFLFLLARWALWQKEGESNKGPLPVKVSIARVESKDMPHTIDLVGSVVPYETVAIKSRIDSQIVKVNFKHGDFVQEGQVLFELDSRVIRAQVEQQKATLLKDEAELDRAQRQLDRDDKLKDKGFSSVEKYDTSKNSYEAAKATIQATKAQLENLQTQLDYCTIKAPISGRAGTINLTVGNTVKANDTPAIVIINQIKPIRVQIPLPQRYISLLQEALAKGEVKVNAQDSSDHPLGQGQITYKENALDETTRNLSIRAEFANADEKLWPGMFVDLKLFIGIDHNALVVPQEAVQPGQQNMYVFKIENNKAKKVSVTLKRTEGLLALIEGDLKPGDMVVTDGHLKLKDESSVVIATGTK